MALAGTGVGVGMGVGLGLGCTTEGEGFFPQPDNSRQARVAVARNEFLRVTPSFYAHCPGETNLFLSPGFYLL